MRLIASLALLASLTAHAAPEPPTDIIGEFPAPNMAIFQAAKAGLEKYRDTRPFRKEITITADQVSGLIETNWYPEHKGEVQIKAQVAVWGTSFRVDVWQYSGLLWRSVKKTGHSRRFERELQEAIQRELPQAQHN
jgi:hypothetical protein